MTKDHMQSINKGGWTRQSSIVGRFFLLVGAGFVVILCIQSFIVIRVLTSAKVSNCRIIVQRSHALPKTKYTKMFSWKREIFFLRRRYTTDNQLIQIAAVLLLLYMTYGPLIEDDGSGVLSQRKMLYAKHQ